MPQRLLARPVSPLAKLLAEPAPVQTRPKAVLTPARRKKFTGSGPALSKPSQGSTSRSWGRDRARAHD